MASVHDVICRMEGMVSTLATGVASQGVGTWIEACKAVMRSPNLREQTDWEFKMVPDIDETSAAGDTAPETGCTLYGLLVGQKSADASEDYIALCDDADGTIAAFAHTDSRFTDIPKIQLWLLAATTDGTEEYHGVVIPTGLVFTNYMSFAAEGEDGTNPATDDLRAWALYRTS